MIDLETLNQKNKVPSEYSASLINSGGVFLGGAEARLTLNKRNMD